MELFPDAIVAELLANGEARRADPEGERRPPIRPVVKIFGGAGTWLIAEMDPDDPDMLFGLCDLGMGFPELGYVLRSELESTRVPLTVVTAGPTAHRVGLPLERDLYWEPRGSLLEYAEASMRAQQIVQLEEVSA